MREIIITANDAGRRLDRFLRKYLKNASLGEIYKLIRKDVKVSGKRRNESYMLSEGDTLTLYISDDVLASLTGSSDDERGHFRNQQSAASRRAKRQFRIIYEDDKVLIVSKPYGLLTHGDSHEKKNHLANQVRDYLIDKGDYDPRSEKVFSPAPANRLDRNTTGLVLFGKTSAALKALNEAIREDLTDKFYMTIAFGIIESETVLTGTLTKDEVSNRVTVSFAPDDRPHAESAGTNKEHSIVTVVKPLRYLTVGGIDTTLAEVKLVTGRSHQIRAHLAGIGHPLAGDSKYALSTKKADRATAEKICKLNEYMARRYGVTAQLLHAYRISFAETGLPEEIQYLAGKSFTAQLPASFERITGESFG